jgi:hypothetical protein
MTENSNSDLDASGVLEERAAISGLTTAIEMILPALARFIEFDKPEQTAAQRAIWSAQLDEPLPWQTR